MGMEVERKQAISVREYQERLRPTTEESYW